jgi:hypothetical protein
MDEQTIIPPEQFVTADVVSVFLSIPPRRVLELARAGQIPACPIDPTSRRKEWRFLLSEVAAAFRSKKPNASWTAEPQKLAFKRRNAREQNG